MGVEVEIKDSGATALGQRLESLGQALTIGLHEDAPDYEDGTTVATVGSAHEFGTDTLPQRSWLRGWVDSGGEKKVGDTGQTQITEVVDGAAPDTVSVEVGDMAVKGITDRMDSGLLGDNGVIRELNDTGHMRDSIAWEQEP